MYTKQPKKMLIMNILDILKKHSDENHTLSQKDISDILESEYDMSADRKAIKRNLDDLIDFGFPIEYKETIRRIPGKDPITGEKIKEESSKKTDFYLEREFTNAELRLLIDGLLFSKHVPYAQCKKLVEKLEGLSNKYFKSRVGFISRLSDESTDNKQVFLNIEVLDEAIAGNRKVSFKYLEYDTDKKQHVKKDADGNERIYVVSPYQMAAREGKYYLICNYNKYEDISNYRIDRITDIKILENEVAKPFEKLKWSKGKQYIDLAEYMKEHPYMYSSDNVRVSFRIVNPMISDVIDIFGKDVRFTDKDESHVTVTTTTNERAAEQFAMNYAPDVVVLKPEGLREKIREKVRITMEAYWNE